MADDPTIINDEQAELFQPQVFLMKNWKYFVYKRVIDRQNKKYNNLSCIDAANPYEINNLLLGTNKIKDYMNFERLDLQKNRIKKYIKISKVYNDGMEIPFNLLYATSAKDNAAFDQVLESTSRNELASITANNFTWTREGNTVAEWRASIEASLQLRLSSLQLIDAKHYGGGNATLNGKKVTAEEVKKKGRSAKISDLITVPTVTISNGQNLTASMSSLPTPAAAISSLGMVPNRDYYTIKVDVGYEINKKIPKGMGDAINNIVSQQRSSLILSPYEHDINFIAIGDTSNQRTSFRNPVELKINFKGHIPSLLSQFDVFQEPQPHSFNPYGGVISTETDVKEINKDFGLIINKLLNSKSIYYQYITKKDVLVGNEDGEEIYASRYSIKGASDFSTALDNDMKDYISTNPEDEDEAEAAGEALHDIRTVNDQELNLQWFYLGDLLDTVLGTVFENTNAKGIIDKVRFLLGTTVVYDEHGIPYSVNIGDFPVSLETFSLWFREKIINSKVKDFSVSYFLNNVFNSLIKATYGPLAEFEKKITIPQLSFTTFSLPEKNNEDPLSFIKPGASVNISNAGFLDLKLNSKDKHSPHRSYYLINSIGGRLNYSGAGNENTDSLKGIPHITSFVKGPASEISFSKITDSALQLVLLKRSSGASGFNGILRNIYNANLKLAVGTPTFAPGTVIYISPTGLKISPHMSKKIGLGGYYGIRKATHVYNLTPDSRDSGFGWTTEIECDWLSETNSEEMQTREFNYTDPEYADPENVPENVTQQIRNE